MKAVVIHAPGAPEQLVIADVPEPKPAPGDADAVAADGAKRVVITTNEDFEQVVFDFTNGCGVTFPRIGDAQIRDYVHFVGACQVTTISAERDCRPDQADRDAFQ